jgi:hypothetical protein
MTEKEKAEKLSKELQESSNQIYRHLIKIKEKMSDIEDDSWDLQATYDKLFFRWRLFDNALYDQRARWNELEKKEV